MSAQKRALITGGSAGLGRALCDQLAKQGYGVVNIDRTAPKESGNGQHIACDFADRAQIAHLIEMLATHEPFDLVIFNAGISATGKFEEIEPQAHARVLQINAHAPIMLCASMVAKKMIARGGQVGFISSLSHFTGYPGAASYAAAKDAIAVYAKSIRKPFAKAARISVTCAFPGPLKTDHAARHAPNGASDEKRMTPDEAAGRILADIQAGKAQSLPGGGARLFAFMGRMAPASMTFAMRKIIYEKLDKTVAD